MSFELGYSRAPPSESSRDLDQPRASIENVLGDQCVHFGILPRSNTRGNCAGQSPNPSQNLQSSLLMGIYSMPRIGFARRSLGAMIVLTDVQFACPSSLQVLVPVKLENVFYKSL